MENIVKADYVWGNFPQPTSAKNIPAWVDSSVEIANIKTPACGSLIELAKDMNSVPISERIGYHAEVLKVCADNEGVTQLLNNDVTVAYVEFVKVLINILPF